MTVKTAFPPNRFPHALFQRVPGTLWVVLGALVIYAIVSSLILAAHPEAEPRFRLSLDPILTASLAIQVHVTAAISALLIGALILLAPKGIGFHKTMGWAWVIAMVITAISSFFLTGLMGNSLSPIHALSAWAMISLPFGIAAIRRRDIRQHRQSMTGMFVGALVIAGLFSFLPGRLMWEMLFAT
ncbi:MAG: DUF2306 domain-containing protein [Henriciella sp.]|nr:DUF2306 domain-containing protein [Henriciella sp.]